MEGRGAPQIRKGEWWGEGMSRGLAWDLQVWVRVLAAAQERELGSQKGETI